MKINFDNVKNHVIMNHQINDVMIKYQKLF